MNQVDTDTLIGLLIYDYRTSRRLREVLEAGGRNCRTKALSVIKENKAKQDAFAKMQTPRIDVERRLADVEVKNTAQPKKKVRDNTSSPKRSRKARSRKCKTTNTAKKDNKRASKSSKRI